LHCFLPIFVVIAIAFANTDGERKSNTANPTNQHPVLFIPSANRQKYMKMPGTAGARIRPNLSIFPRD
jgi:hypothetical protein